MNVKVLGSGCANCQTLEERVHTALSTLGKEADVDHVTDFGEIASWGVMSTPALVVDDEVVVSGRVPSVEEIATLLS